MIMYTMHSNSRDRQNCLSNHQIVICICSDSVFVRLKEKYQQILRRQCCLTRESIYLHWSHSWWTEVKEFGYSEMWPVLNTTDRL